MSHDITHCDAQLPENNVCDKCEQCHRYHAHVELETNPHEFYRIVYIDAGDCISNDYSMFWEE